MSRDTPTEGEPTPKQAGSMHMEGGEDVSRTGTPAQLGMHPFLWKKMEPLTWG